MIDRIAKQKLNVIIVVDTSSSMRGNRIKQVNAAIDDIRRYLIDLQGESVNVDFNVSILTFGTTATWVNGSDGDNVETMQFTPIKAGGYSNIHLAYKELRYALEKQSRGGMMPDFGGVAPIILLLTDGHPTSGPVKRELDQLKCKPWFKVALKYGVAIAADDERTHKVLKDFVGDSGDVIDCFDPEILKKIIKVIVLTASKVKSKSTGVGTETHSHESHEAENNVVAEIKQQVGYALQEVDDWEW